MDETTGDPVMLTLKNILNNDGTPLFVKDQRIGTLPRAGVNMAASKSLGIKGVRAAEAQSRVPKTSAQSAQPQQKSIKQSDIAAKAKASGYTPSEYESLLRKNNVKIIK